MNETIPKGLDPVTSSSQPFLWPILKNFLPRNKRVRVLDIGCGPGNHSRRVAALGHKVVGVDVSEDAVVAAKKKNPGIRFICAEINSLPWNEIEGRFDVVIAMEVVEHLYYPRSLLQTGRRSLRPGGTLILSTPYHGYLKNLMISLLNRWDEHFNVTSDGWHIKFFSPHTLRNLLIEQGFVGIEFRFGGRFPLLWKSMVCRSKKPD